MKNKKNEFQFALDLSFSIGPYMKIITLFAKSVDLGEVAQYEAHH